MRGTTLPGRRVTNVHPSSHLDMHIRSLAAGALLLALPAAAQQPAPRSYAGQWRLDLAQSRDLPAFYAGLREHRLAITQDDSTLHVAVALVDTAGAEQRLEFPYRLDRPVQVTSQVRTPAGPRDIPTTLTATRRPDGGIDIDIARELRTPGGIVRPKDHESWQLSADGRQILIDREAEMPGPDGVRTMRTHYVFVRS